MKGATPSTKMKYLLFFSLAAGIMAMCCSYPGKTQPPRNATVSESNRQEEPGVDLFKWDRPSFPGSLPITSSATCRFKKEIGATYEKRISNEEPNPPERVYYGIFDEDEEDTVSFLDLNTKEPKVLSNSGQSPLTIIYNDGAELTLLNHQNNLMGTTGMYTIFRDRGIVIHSQHENVLLFYPLGILEMGYCNH